MVDPIRSRATGAKAIATARKLEEAEEFRKLVQESAMYKESNFILWPSRWQSYGDTGYDWKDELLLEGNIPNIPDSSGIYTLVVLPSLAGHPHLSYVMYVGMAESLQDRFYDYVKKEKRFVIRGNIHMLLNKYDGYIIFCYTEIGEGRSEVRRCEKELYNVILPPYNGLIEGRLGKIRSALP